ncbi:MAG: hypothetical protein CMH57_10230 [Myxococcales bacterium]|nr:hypothetical protein [Myxococcales bacterium]
MAIEYRYLIRLTTVEEGRQEQLAASLRTTDRRSGRDKWVQLVAQAEAGEEPVVFRTNSSTEADRIMRAIATAGGAGELVDQLDG